MQRISEIGVLSAIALSDLLGNRDDVIKRFEVETIRFKKSLRSDEMSAAMAAFVSRKT